MLSTHAARPRRAQSSRGVLARRCAGLLVLALLAGCNRWQAPVVTVPIKTDAANQYAFASAYQHQANLGLILDVDKYRQTRDVVRQTFGKVIEYFPGDRTYTPLAKLDVIEIGVGLGLDNPQPRVLPSKSQVHRAIAEIDTIAKDYPEHEFVHAKALYLQGNYHKWLGEYPEAQDCFKQVMDKYTKHKDPHIADIARRAKIFYDQVYVGK